MNSVRWKFFICIIKILRKNKEDILSLQAEITQVNILQVKMSVDLKIATVLLHQIHLILCNLLVFQ